MSRKIVGKKKENSLLLLAYKEEDIIIQDEWFLNIEACNHMCRYINLFKKLDKIVNR